MEYVIILILLGISCKFYSEKEKWVKSYQEGENLINNARIEKNRIMDSARIEENKIISNARIEENKINKRIDFMKQMEHSSINKFPILATVLADYELAVDKSTEEYLRNKKRPAIKSADEVKKLRNEKRELIALNKAYEWELKHLKMLLPWLADIEEEPITPVNEYVNADFKEKDAAGFWLTPDEYKKLTNIEKYQLALDRYCKRNKTNKEIGTDYERFVGYKYEQAGYNVEYVGIENGMEDLGRDLICMNNKEILIIQCKCWSNLKNKVIHEKHINQLYGTAMMYKLKNKPNKIVKPIFVSTVPCTPVAKEFADYLGIEFLLLPLGKYPMIKCNVNKSTKEKIYHLPFDQQYDKCVIRNELGECYSMTVAEAERKGFRRAMRWYGNHIV